MTAKEKAEEIVDKMYFSRRYLEGEDYIPTQAFIHAKQCALIAVDEILLHIGTNSESHVWIKVKHEIEKL